MFPEVALCLAKGYPYRYYIMLLDRVNSDVQVDLLETVVIICSKNNSDSRAPLGLPRPRVPPRPTHTAIFFCARRITGAVPNSTSGGHRYCANIYLYY